VNYIEEILTERFKLSLTRAQSKEITIETLRYIFKFIDATKYKRFLKKTLGDFDRVVDIQRAILSEGYLLKNVKLWYYYVVANGLVRKNRIHYAEMFNIADEDIELLSLAGALTTDFDKLIKKKYPALTIPDFEKVVVYALKKSDSFTKKFVNRKMAFIIRTQGIEAMDLVNEVKEAAIHSIMFTYPRFKTFDHCFNITKRTIHNRGVNLMEFYSGPNRSKLIKNESGFTNKSVPLTFAVKDDVCSEFMQCNLQNNEEDLDDVITVKQLLRSFSGKRQYLLRLMLDYDEKFTEYLQQNKITKGTNDDYRDNCRDFKTYTNHCLDYLGVSHEKGERFLQKLKQKISA